MNPGHGVETKESSEQSQGIQKSFLDKNFPWPEKTHSQFQECQKDFNNLKIEMQFSFLIQTQFVK